MKGIQTKSALARACIGGALALLSAAADASVTLYGRLDTDIEYQKGDRKSVV